MSNDKRAYRRQIKTTLDQIHEKVLDKFCVEKGITESRFVREAVLNKLNTFLSDEAIQSVKEISLA